jgi:hypothetical protein
VGAWLGTRLGSRSLWQIVAICWERRVVLRMCECFECGVEESVDVFDG